MRKRSSIWQAAVAAAVACAVPPALAQRILSDPTVVAQHPLPDYSYAGYGFGVAPLPTASGTIIDAASHGVVPDDGLDDSKAMQRALTAARQVAGPVVLQLPRGRIQLTEVLRINRGDFVLRGAGSAAGGTELWLPRPLDLVDRSPQWDELRRYLVAENKREVQPENNIDYLFSEWSWSGGFILVGPAGSRPVSYDATKDVRDPVLTPALSGKQFSHALTVADPSALKPGMVVQLQWFAIDGKDSAILRSIYGDTDLPIGSHHWTFANRPTVAQATRITAVKGNRITIGDPLLHDVGAAQPAMIAQWAHLERVGIESLAFRFPEGQSFGHHLEQGFNALYLTGLFDGWARDLAIHNADSAILTDNAASLTLRDITTTGDRVAHYAVHVGAAHNVLVQRLRIENSVIHPLSVNTRSTKAVITDAVVLRNAVLDQHSGSNHQNLFDSLTLNIAPVSVGGGWHYRLWEGGGAPYWKPGHGLHNTGWNIRIVPPNAFPGDETIRVVSGLEGPGANVIGLWSAGNAVQLDYRPRPYAEDIGAAPLTKSLYEYQLSRRNRSAPTKQ